jgi:CrcB protein
MDTRIGSVRRVPVGSGVDLRVPAQRREFSWRQLGVLGMIALGGGLGGLARHGLAVAVPALPGRIPWGTLGANVIGCALIGVLMVLVTEVWSAHRLLRPFLGVGLLGGFTTFSTYAAEVRGLLQPGTALIGLLYLAGTVLCCLLATIVAVWLTRLVTGRARGGRSVS